MSHMTEKYPCPICGFLNYECERACKDCGFKLNPKNIEKNSLKREVLSMDKIPNISIKYLKLALKTMAYKSLDKFMNGKTGVIRKDGELGIYLWDFELWAEKYSRGKIE